MSGIPNPPNLIVLGPTHPTPFAPAPCRTRRTLDVITPIHLLNPTSAVARLGVGFKPDARLLIRSKVLVAEPGPVFRAGEIWVGGGPALKAGFETAGRTSEVR